jgi:hypothetical protein
LADRRTGEALWQSPNPDRLKENVTGRCIKELAQAEKRVLMPVRSFTSSADAKTFSNGNVIS